MAIALDTTTAQALASSRSWSHTCTGLSLILIVTLSEFPDDGVSYSNAISYNGVSLTKLADYGARSQVYYLINPATGAHNVVVSGGNYTGGYNGEATSASYTGAKQSSFPDSSNTGSNSGSNSITINTTVIASNCWLLFADFSGGTTTSNRTDRVTASMNGGNSYFLYGDSNGTVSTGSQGVTFTQSSGTRSHDGIIMSLAPVPVNGNFLDII